MISYQKRIILYVVWYCLITFIGMQTYQMGLNSNTQGSQCVPDEWRYGDMYQWVWDGQPCQFSADFLVGYIFYFVLYLLFDYVRKLVLKFNPSVLWRGIEVLVWLIAYWIYVLWLTKTEYGELDLVMCWTALLGSLFFFLPFFGGAIALRLLKGKL